MQGRLASTPGGLLFVSDRVMHTPHNAEGHLPSLRSPLVDLPIGGRDDGADIGASESLPDPEHRRHEGIESSRRTRVRPAAEGQALGTTEVGAGSMIDVPRRISVMARADSS